MTLMRSIVQVGNFTILSRILGFVRDLLLGFYVGTGPVMDAIAAAIKLPSFFRRLFGEGAFNAAFVPLFAGTLATEGEGPARSLAEEVMAWMVWIIFCVTLFVEIFPRQFVEVFAYGFTKTPERFDLLVQFTRLSFPYLLFICLTALFSGILNSLDRFVAASSSQAAGNTFLVLVLLCFGTDPNVGSYVSLSIFLSGVIQFLWVLIPAWRQGFNLRLLRPRLSGKVLDFFKRMIPGAIGSGVTQINLLVGTLIASFLPIGGMSYLYYADRLNQLPLSVIGTAVATALLPVLSRQLRQGHLDEARSSQNRCLEYASLLVMPSTLALCIGAPSFVKVLFERGEFTAVSSHETMLALIGYAWGLPAYILMKIFTTSFFARHDTKTPVTVAVISVGVDIILSLLLFKPLQHVGLAIATAASGWVSALILGILLRRRGLLVIDARFKRFFPKAVGAACACGIVVFLLQEFLTFPLESWMKYVHLLLLVSGGLGAFILVLVFTKAISREDLRESLSRPSSKT